MKRILAKIVDTSTGMPQTDWGLLFLRVMVGSFMLFGHGWGKLTGYVERMAAFPDPLGVSSPVSMTLVVFAEFFCSIFIFLGFGTRLAALVLLINMLVAGGIIHSDDPWGKKELAFMYAIAYATILIAGAGRFSLDRKFFKTT